MIVPHFVGATASDRGRAQIEYGITACSTWILPILGPDATTQIEAFIRSLPIPATA